MFRPVAAHQLLVVAINGLCAANVWGAGPSDGLNVNVVNTPANPVPVTGSTTVSGSVSATQSGTWTVGISGQPIAIKNGRTPYQEQRSASGGSGCGTVVCGPTFTFSPVPSGKQLVITAVSVTFAVLSGASVFGAELNATGGGMADVTFTIPMIRQAATFEPGTELWITSPQQTTFYVGAGQTPLVFANVDTPHLSNERSFATLVGYYEPAP